MVRKKSEQNSVTMNMTAENKGIGTLTIEHLVSDASELHHKGRVFCHSKLAPGSEMNTHPHTDETEVYYVIAGTGLFNDDGIQTPVSVGDVLITNPGQCHGLKNTGDIPLEFVAIAIYA